MTWGEVGAGSSIASLVAVLRLIFSAGALRQEIKDLNSRVSNIDKYGCRAAVHIHKEPAD